MRCYHVAAARHVVPQTGHLTISHLDCWLRKASPTSPRTRISITRIIFRHPALWVAEPKCVAVLDVVADQVIKLIGKMRKP